MKRRITMLMLVLGLIGSLSASDSLQFRGPHRNGLYEAKNLLKKWPEKGPEVLWTAEGLGKGFASITTAGDRVFTTGEINFKEFLFAFDSKGKALWQTEYGQAHDGGGYPGTRTTPTFDDDLVYVMSSMGRAVCVDATNGEIVWQVDTFARFAKGKKAETLIPRWGIAESVLIDGDKLICTPGAPGASVVALNKKTGETLWQTKELSEVSGYCSARVYAHKNIRQIVTLTGKSLVGLDPESGRLLWKQDYPVSWDIHANSPMFHEDIIYVSDGYNHGGRAFKMAADGSGVKQIWAEETLDIHHGGGVVVDGRVYGAAGRNKWISLDIKTGEVVARGRGTGKGSIVYADGLLYGYGESGRIGLIDPSGKELEPLSKFRLQQGSGQHWAHPVISHGRLYIRHGDVLLCYNISKN